MIPWVKSPRTTSAEPEPGRERAAHRVDDSGAVDVVRGHLGQPLAGRAAGLPQVALPGRPGDEAVDLEAIGLDGRHRVGQVADHPARGGVVRAPVDRVAGRHRRRRDGRRPGGRGIGAEEDRRVDRAPDRLLEERADLAPHVVRRIVEDGFGDRDDRRELFRVQVLVRPVDLGRLLEARVAVDEVGDRQGRDDRDALLAARHRDVAKELQGGRLLNRAPSDLGRHLFGDGRRGVGPRDDVGVGHEGSPCE
jgi:hypothetical protein